MLADVTRNAVLRGLAGVVAYVALDYISFVDSYQGLAITPWSPAAGAALAIVLLGGLRYAPYVLVAPAIAGALVRAGSVPAALHLIEGVLLGGSYLLAGLAARRLRLIDPRLPSVRDVLMLMLLALATGVVAALTYVGALALAGLLPAQALAGGFARFVVGDLIGMLIVTPLILLAGSRRPWPAPARAWEPALQLGAIGAAFAAIFALPHASEYQLFYLLFLPLMWCAFRSGIVGAAVALAVIQIGLILALHLREGTEAALTSFQMLMISLAATGLVFGSLVSQQQATALRLRHQQLALNRAFRLRSMGELATTIAHEVNQPITSIKTFAGIAHAALEGRDPRRAAEAILRIRSECDRAGSIIRSTREFLRQRAVQPQPVNVEQMLAELRELLLDRLEVNRVRWTTRIDPPAQTVAGDPVQLKQALYNIIDNGIDAIESAGGGGALHVAVRALDGTTVEFEVQDTGTGFPEDLRDEGVTPLVTTKADGTGLGLSIARSVAEAHGGGLAIDHRHEGTVVRLRLATTQRIAHEHGDDHR